MVRILNLIEFVPATYYGWDNRPTCRECWTHTLYGVLGILTLL